MHNLIFNGEGPVMEGTWYNPTNGDSFTVMDSYFQDNQYIVKTTDGRMLDYNFIQNYIKSDKPIPKQIKPTAPVKQELPAEVASLLADDVNNDILADDLQLINGQATKPKVTSLGNLHKVEIDPEESIIEKALSKKSIPTIISTVFWEEFPKKEIEALKDIMDIPMEKVIGWYIKNLNINDIKMSVEAAIKEHIEYKLNPNQQFKEIEDEAFMCPMVEEPVVEEKPKKTKAPKKTKTK